MRWCWVNFFGLQRWPYAGRASLATAYATCDTLHGDLQVVLIPQGIAASKPQRDAHRGRTSRVLYRASLTPLAPPAPPDIRPRRPVFSGGRVRRHGGGPKSPIARQLADGRFWATFAAFGGGSACLWAPICAILGSKARCLSHFERTCARAPVPVTCFPSRSCDDFGKRSLRGFRGV
jgi:hypothetical protein